MIRNGLIAGMFVGCCGTFQAVACTGIALTAADGSYVQSRTIEWSLGELDSEYVVIPRGEQLFSFTPTGEKGLRYSAKYGLVGLSVARSEFIAEGINEAGLSAGLFFSPIRRLRELRSVAERPHLGRLAGGDLDTVAIRHHRRA